MRNGVKITLCMLVAGLSPQFLAAADLHARPSDAYTTLNLNFPDKSEKLNISISREQSRAYHWKPGQRITLIVVSSHRDGREEHLIDAAGQKSWELFLDKNGEASLSILPDASNFSGRLLVRGNGKILYAATPYLAESLGKTLEKIYEYRFWDGAILRVHFTDQILEEAGADVYFPREVLDAAVSAYQTITQFEGFNTPGYSFAQPDKNYAYDPDKAIDIYLGNPKDDNRFQNHGYSNLSFKDAPCFDTIRLGRHRYEAVILLPANYQEFIKNWEKINPSPLGTRNINVDIRGTLTHEMLHVILFYYNKNLSRDDVAEKGKPKELDWYVEGLARYFETFAGARHDFYSQGFKQVLPDKIRFSRGGSNYFMRYPDQAFIGLRYENALFWRFMDTQYGMSAIERLSREFRQEEPENFKLILEKVTGVSFKKLMKKYARSILFKDFGLKDDSVYLMDVAMTRLNYRDNNLYLRDGLGEEIRLGHTSRTDWIGEWGQFRSAHGTPAAAGDNTDEADVSGWATDYEEITFDKGLTKLPWLGVYHKNGLAGLDVQFVLIGKGGSHFMRELDDIAPGLSRGLDLARAMKTEGLDATSLEKVYLLITNTHPRNTSTYEIRTSPRKRGSA